MTSPCEVVETPFVAQDGLTYASAAERLLGRPEKTSRNVEIVSLREGGVPEEVVERYWRAYDRRAPYHRSPNGFAHGECHRTAYDEASGRIEDRERWLNSPECVRRAALRASSNP